MNVRPSPTLVSTEPRSTDAVSRNVAATTGTAGHSDSSGTSTPWSTRPSRIGRSQADDRSLTIPSTVGWVARMTPSQPEVGERAGHQPVHPRSRPMRRQEHDRLDLGELEPGDGRPHRSYGRGVLLAGHRRKEHRSMRHDRSAREGRRTRVSPVAGSELKEISAAGRWFRGDERQGHAAQRLASGPVDELSLEVM